MSDNHTPVPEIIEWRGVKAYRRCSVCGRMLDDDGKHAETAPAQPRRLSRGGG